MKFSTFLSVGLLLYITHMKMFSSIRKYVRPHCNKCPIYSSIIYIQWEKWNILQNPDKHEGESLQLLHQNITWRSKPKKNNWLRQEQMNKVNRYMCFFSPQRMSLHKTLLIIHEIQIQIKRHIWSRIFLINEHCAIWMVKITTGVPYLKNGYLNRIRIKQTICDSYQFTIFRNIWAQISFHYQTQGTEQASITFPRDVPCKETSCFHPLPFKWWQRISYLFPNLKHLLCLPSVILGAWGRLLGGFVTVCFSIAFMNLRKCLMYSG